MFVYFDDFNCSDMIVNKTEKQSFGRLSKKFLVKNDIDLKNNLKVKFLINSENINEIGICFLKNQGGLNPQNNQFFISKKLNIEKGHYRLVKNTSDSIGVFFVIEKIKENEK